jgi:aminopeptidase N
VCDEWIHEGWGTYLEGVYVEHMFGKADAITYLNGYKSKVRNREPVVTTCGINRTPSQDMYFKGALFINTLRSVVNDDARWWQLVRAFYGQFKYRNITTGDVQAFFNKGTGLNLTPIFDQYLKHADLPTLELLVDQSGGKVWYRWKADERGFAMPIKVGRKGAWQLITPTTDWKTMTWGLKPEAFEVATDLYYINVSRW